MGFVNLSMWACVIKIYMLHGFIWDCFLTFRQNPWNCFGTSELTQNTNVLLSNMAVLEFSKIEATKQNGQRMVLNTCVKLIWAVTLEDVCFQWKKESKFTKMLTFDLVFIVSQFSLQSKVHIRLPNKSIVSTGDQLIPACSELSEFKGFPKVTKWHQLGQC